MRTAATLALAISLISSSALFDTAAAQSPRQEAEEAAGAVTGATNAAKSDPDALGAAVPGFQTANPEALTQHYENDGAGLEDATLQGLGNDDDGEGGEAASTILNTYTTRPDISVLRTDDFLSQSRGTLGNPDLLAGDLFSSNENPACQPTPINPDPLEIKSCDAYRSGGDSTCAIGTEVDVLAEKTYACFRETATYRKRCEEELTVQCTQILSNCRLSDGLITTPDPDLQLSYVNFRHRAVLPTQDSDQCRQFTRRMVINVTDISKLATARLSRVDFHDALSVYVNGVFVWGGPYGDGSQQNLAGDWPIGRIGFDGEEEYRVGIGDPLSTELGPFGSNQYLGTCFRPSATVATVGVDIKPLLNQGANVVEFRNAIGGIGGFTADFQILMQCCGNWQETWSQTCPY